MGNSAAVDAHVAKANTLSAWVWFTGTTALLEGQAVCYDWDNATVAVASASGRRRNYVELPSITNSRYFAGVAARAYSAKSTGQMIEIYLPGSTCNILSRASTTIGVGILTFECGGTYAGYFRYAGFEGEGSAVPGQTVDRSSTAGVCQANLQVGLPSGGVDYVDADTGGAITCMVGGMTILDATGTPASNATFTVADGTTPNLKKGFRCVVDYGDSYDFIITVNGTQLDGTTALQTIVLDDINDEDQIEWTLDWYEKGRVGATVT
jgi:hypothetical protein